MANDTGDETVWGQLDSLVELARSNSERPGLVKLYTTASGEATDADHPAHGWLREHLSAAIDELYDAFETGKALGIVRPEAPSASLARSTIALLDGLQIQWLAAATPAQSAAGAFDSPAVPRAADIDEMSRDVKVFVDGLRALCSCPTGTDPSRRLSVSPNAEVERSHRLPRRAHASSGRSLPTGDTAEQGQLSGTFSRPMLDSIARFLVSMTSQET